MKRYYPALLAFLLGFALIWSSGKVFAQQSVLPGYQICSSASGSTICSFQPVDLTHGLPVTPVAPTPGTIIGTVAIDQTSPGTTNGVVANASEAHIGEVGGNIIPIMNAMTTSANAITAGESLGGLQTIAGAVRVSGALGAGGTSGIIQSVMVTFSDAIGFGPLNVYYFNANPTGSTCTDNVVFALAAADRDKVIGIAHVSDFTSSGTPVIAQAQNQAMPFGVASATSIFACVVSGGSITPTGTSNASLLTRIMRN